MIEHVSTTWVLNSFNHVFFQVKEGKLAQSGDTTMEHEIACIDVTPLDEEKEKSDIVAVGLWTDITVGH